jgi:hypothetical protein
VSETGAEFIPSGVAVDGTLAQNRRLQGDLARAVAAIRSIASRYHVSYHASDQPWEDCRQLSCLEGQATLKSIGPLT